MSHFTFIAASYGVSLLALGLLAAWLVLDYRTQKAALQALKTRDRKLRRSVAASASIAPPDAREAQP